MTRPMPGPPEDCYCRSGNAACQECETRGYPYSWGLCPGCDIHNGRSKSHYKRLTDAECAAEMWRERAEWWAGMHTKGPTAEDVDIRRATTWERFATHPHADLKETRND